MILGLLKMPRRAEIPTDGGSSMLRTPLISERNRVADAGADSCPHSEEAVGRRHALNSFSANHHE